MSYEDLDNDHVCGGHLVMCAIKWLMQWVSMEWDQNRENVLMIMMVILLLLLSAVVWVAFCVAVKKTARKFIELKRQRRREALIAAAIHRVANGTEAERRASLPLYIATVTQGLSLYDNHQELPTYEEALSMSCTPSPNPQTQSISPRPTTAPTRPASRKVDRVLRIAPDRPGALPTLVLPPSYESTVRTGNQPSTSSNSSLPLYTISGRIAESPL